VFETGKGNNICGYYVCEFIHDFTGAKKMTRKEFNVRNKINKNLLHLIQYMNELKIMMFVCDKFGK
jgi:hypothetical protein